MASTIKLKNGSGAPTSGQLVQGEPAFDLTNKRLYTENASGTVIEVGVNPAAEITANGGIALPDNQKATFGAGSDLQIYHDGSNSYITDVGTGNLNIRGHGFLNLQKYDGENFLTCASNGAVTLYYDNASKLATTSTGIDVTGTASADQLNSNNGKLFLDDNGSHNGVINAPASLYVNFDSDNTSASEKIVFGYDRDGTSGGTSVMEISSTGIDVTGTVTADGLTVDGGSGGVTFNGSSDVVSIVQSFAGSPAYIHLDNTIESGGKLWRVGSTGGVAGVGKNFGILNQTDNTNIVNFASNGDISFYEDTGTTAKFFWDASAESLGIGTSSPQSILHLRGATPSLRIENTDGSGNLQITHTGSAYSYGGVGANQAFIYSNDDVSIMADTTHNIKFHTNSAERMRIDSSGNVGIGTTSPAAKLEIGGAGEGIILASPDGTRYKITVANGGILIVTAV